MLRGSSEGLGFRVYVLIYNEYFSPSGPKYTAWVHGRFGLEQMGQVPQAEGLRVWGSILSGLVA